MVVKPNAAALAGFEGGFEFFGVRFGEELELSIGGVSGCVEWV